MPRPIWSGSISFGLINIPVNLYGASMEREFDFDLLHEKDASPIRYARVCRAEGKEVPYDEIVKGYEYRKGDYVIMHDEDFEKADLKKTKSIDVFEFTKPGDIDTVYFEKPFYLEPQDGAGKAYVLLREALKKSKKVGVARYVLRNKEHLGVLKPEGNLIVLDQLRFKDELKRPKISVPKGASTQREIGMALKLIDELTAAFHPEKYHDAYSSKLRSLLNKKAHGKHVRVKGKAPKPTKAPDIMEVLRKSLRKEHRKVSAR